MGIKVRQMKTYILLITAMISLTVSLAGSLPQKQEALQLTEVYTINDLQEGSYRFIWPGVLIVLKDNSLLIADRDQLLHFSPEGKFIRNLLIKGEGPGEISGPFSFYLAGDSVLIYDFIKNKVVKTDFSRRLLDEWKLPFQCDNIISINRNSLTVLKERNPSVTGRNGIFINRTELLRLNMKGGKEAEIFSFPLRYMRSEAGIQSIDHLLLNYISEQYIVASWKREYELNIIDRLTGKIVKTFSRPFISVKSTTSSGRVAGYTDNLPDIRRVMINGKEIWIETAARSIGGSYIIDRFSESGEYISSFSTGIKGHLLQVKNDQFYYLIQDSEDNPTVTKYVKDKDETKNELCSSQYRNCKYKKNLLLPDS